MDHRKIKEAVSVLARGGSVIYPTDTLYGLGVDATNYQAVARLLALKHRDPNKVLSIMVANVAAAKKLAKLNPIAERIIKTKLPGPYTFILPYIQSGTIVPQCIYNGTVAIRMPNHPIALELARAFGKPITATSANISGEKPFNSLKSLRSLGADYILWAGPLPLAQPSTVIDLTKEKPRVLRRGAGQWP
ncbi:threonylcarbamoyl-AMP synthase [Candidatus Berkelbacteria bacterium]|nr:threonylcarbamoyl-AMP synthase [Candidatus Berkelbacteria bacterium]